LIPPNQEKNPKTPLASFAPLRFNYRLLPHEHLNRQDAKHAKKENFFYSANPQSVSFFLIDLSQSGKKPKTLSVLRAFAVQFLPLWTA